MTDLTNQNMSMPATAKRQKQTNGEYRVYLALIFCAALPFCAVIWAYSLIRHMALPKQGPIQKAISEAQTIAPRIFWA